MVSPAAAPSLAWPRARPGFHGRHRSRAREHAPTARPPAVLARSSAVVRRTATGGRRRCPRFASAIGPGRPPVGPRYPPPDPLSQKPGCGIDSVLALSRLQALAKVAELVDALDSGSSG